MRRARVLLVMVASSVLLIGLSLPVAARPGDFDPSFAGRGWVETAFFGDEYIADGGAADVALQRDGKIVVTGTAVDCCNGNWALATVRYRPDGSLDPTFGNGGWVVTDLEDSFAYAVAVQSDGKIVVGGQAPCHVGGCFTLIRYMPDGGLDSTFGDGGLAQARFRLGSTAYDIAIQTDGKIVAVGYTSVGGDANDMFRFAVARFNTNGLLDRTFSGDGLATVDFGYGNDSAYAVAIQGDGKVVVVGEGARNFYATGSDFALARFNRNGSLDRTFSGDGKQTTNFGGTRWDRAHGVAVRRDGRIVVAGASYKNFVYQEPRIAVARYNPNGSLDRSFDLDGRVLTRVGRYGSYVQDVVPYGGGSVLVCGNTRTSPDLGAPYHWILMRLRSDGSRDPSFGNGGVVVSNFGTGQDFAARLAIQPDRRIVVAGQIYLHFGVARYLAS